MTISGTRHSPKKTQTQMSSPGSFTEVPIPGTRLMAYVGNKRVSTEAGDLCHWPVTLVDTHNYDMNPDGNSPPEIYAMGCVELPPDVPMERVAQIAFILWAEE